MVGAMRTQCKLDMVFIIATMNCNASCQACGYWHNKEHRELNPQIIDWLLPHLKKQKINHVVWTGGEPTLHTKLGALMEKTSSLKIENTLITNGIELIKSPSILSQSLNNVAISLDAINSKMYKEIRGIDAFDELRKLPEFIRKTVMATNVSICFLIQKLNIDYISKFLELANRLEVERVAFLVPDLYGYIKPENHGNSFGRYQREYGNSINKILPSSLQLDNLEKSIPKLIGFCEKKAIFDCPTIYTLERYLVYFRDFLKKATPQSNPPCYFPFHRAVITTDGYIKPCFFLPDKFKIKKNQDPFAMNGLLKTKDRIINDRKYRDKHCMYCLQTERK